MDAVSGGWDFWVDRGGTFTDVVARRPDGSLVSHKLLSEDPRRYDDAATAGFGDVLRIGYQTRPHLFKLDIVLPEMLYSEVLEVDERIAADGPVLCPLDLAAVTDGMVAARERGMEAVAIVLVHGYRHTQHEAALAAAAREIGFGQVSVSHEVDPLVKIVPRGEQHRRRGHRMDPSEIVAMTQAGPLGRDGPVRSLSQDVDRCGLPVRRRKRPRSLQLLRQHPARRPLPQNQRLSRQTKQGQGAVVTCPSARTRCRVLLGGAGCLR